MYLQYPPDICTGFLIANGLTNNGTYPMEYGTAVSVQCEGNLELLGSEVVYCKEGINYLYSYRPSCVDPGKYRSNRLHVTLPVVLTAVNFTSIFKD